MNNSSRCFYLVSACVLCVLLFGTALFAAEPPVQADRYEKVFGIRDFRMNQDGLRYEMPENGACKILPRLKNTAVWTHFQVPSKERARSEWNVKAVVRRSEGSAAGVGVWMGDKGYSFYLYPDGRGSLQYYEGRKSVWRSSVEIKNFTYPANLSLRRDANGSIIAEVDDMVATTKLFAIDVKEPRLNDVTSVSFSTHSPASMSGQSGAAVFYERLEVKAWGTQKTPETVDRFEELFGDRD